MPSTRTVPELDPIQILLLHRSVATWLESWAPLRGMPKAERLRLMHEENEWKNSLVMWAFPDSAREAMPHFVQTWVRCWILCAAVYYLLGAAWCYYTYFCFGEQLFKPGTIPGFKDIWEQIKVGLLLPSLMRMCCMLGICSHKQRKTSLTAQLHAPPPPLASSTQLLLQQAHRAQTWLCRLGCAHCCLHCKHACVIMIIMRGAQP